MSTIFIFGVFLSVLVFCAGMCYSFYQVILKQNGTNNLLGDIILLFGVPLLMASPILAAMFFLKIVCFVFL